MEFKSQLIIYVALLAVANVVVHGNRQEYQATVAERVRKVDDRGPPSCASDEMSFQLVLLLDNYSETSWEMKKVSDGSIVGAGAADQYEMPNTQYDASLCLPKGEYSFTIFDGWGDGLTQSATTGHYSGFLDNIEIFEDSDKEWFNETKTFTVAVASTPIACARDAIPFRLELLLDNYNETSWKMKKVSDGSVIVGEGSVDKYKNNTAYKETVCVTNGDYNFTIFDGYGDGLTQGAGHYAEFLDNIEIFSGKDFQKEETTTFTVVVDDPNRGTCENHETVDCAKRASEKKKCTNNVLNTGKTVEFYCPFNCKSECATEALSETPTDAPTKTSTDIPADNFPSVSPNASRSIPPSTVPSDSPSSTPSSLAPTNAPTKAPTNVPTTTPTRAPTTAPTTAPTSLRTPAPTPTPLAPTTRAPFPGPRTATPTGRPSVDETICFVADCDDIIYADCSQCREPSTTFEELCFVADCDDIIYANCSQCREPSREPTMTPTMTPTITPTMTPTFEPTTNPPTFEPTFEPTTTAPTTAPTTTAPSPAPTSLRTPAPTPLAPTTRAPFPGPRTATPTGRTSVDETECFLPNCDADPVPDCAQCREPSRKEVPIPIV